jgi:predicted secreted protein
VGVGVTVGVTVGVGVGVQVGVVVAPAGVEAKEETASVSNNTVMKAPINFFENAKFILKTKTAQRQLLNDY